MREGHGARTGGWGVLQSQWEYLWFFSPNLWVSFGPLKRRLSDSSCIGVMNVIIETDYVHSVGWVSSNSYRP